MNKDSEIIYASLFENMLDGLAYCQMIFDAQGCPVDFLYIQVNKNFETLTGLQGAEGKKVSTLVPGIQESNPEILEIYGRVSLTGKPEKFETYVGPLARWFFVSVHSPKKGFFIAVFQNTTEQKSIKNDLENARIAALNVLKDLQEETGTLARAKALDEALLQSLGEGVIATDRSSKMIIMNRVAEYLLGFTEAEIMGKPVTQFIALEDAQSRHVPDALQPITLALALTKPTTTSDYYFVRKDGTKFPVAIMATPILLDGKPTGAVVVFRDITKEKELEKLRTDFLSLASHQLRTPLSGTKWLIETIRRGITGELNAKQKLYLDNLYQINERMIELVADMLNVLFLESGALIIGKDGVSVASIFTELLLIMEPVAHAKGVILRNLFNAHAALAVRADSQALRSILESFVSNAINYSPTGGEVVFNAKEELVTIIFSVQDHGIGIPKDEQVRIFERFYRSSNAKKFKPDGTGLGLYTAFLLAQKISGKVSFISEEGVGTTFYLEVPKKIIQGDTVIHNQTI